MHETSLLKEMLGKMLLIRRLQERIEGLYLDDEMKTPVHLYIGQEAVAVGVCQALHREDYIQSNHRGHGHYLAKGGDLKRLVAELFCRSTGCSKGFGGSMHLVDVSVGHLGSSSIVGGGIPIGTGLGLAAQMQGDGRVSVVFFGDGAADEGVLYESVNFAMLKRLPVIYIMENNGWSVCSPVTARHPCDNVFLRGVPADLLFTARVDGNDVTAVYTAASAAVCRARTGAGPSLIECRTYRLPGHAGCKTQDMPGYRDEEEIRRWEDRSPIDRLITSLLESGRMTGTELDEMEANIVDRIDEAFEYARQSPWPADDDLDKYFFCE